MKLVKMTLAVSTVFAAALSQASISTFYGYDLGANSTDPHPNSDSAAAAFDSFIGSHGVITFESAPLGAFGSLNAAPGVTVTGVDFYTNQQTILNAPYGTPDALFGYNTTSGGSNFLNMLGGTVTFNFASVQHFFGAYIGGIQDEFGPDSLQWNDGADQSMAITSDVAAGGMSFAGFYDTDGFTSVTVSMPADFVSIDDVRVNAVPEPASMACLGLGAIALIRRRKNSK